MHPETAGATPASMIGSTTAPGLDVRLSVSAARPAGARARRAATALAGSRLLHFLVAGGLVFALAPRPESRTDVTLDAATLAALETAEANRLGAVRLDPATAGAVRARAVEDEILYREALRLGFDRNDNVVRQRLIQKVLFLAEDLAGTSRPADEQALRAFFESTRAQWTWPERLRLVQVYAGPARRDRLAALRDQAVAVEAQAPGEPPPLGDQFSLPRAATVTRAELVRDYGEGFSAAVGSLPAGAWSEPIRSRFGWHLVKVVERHAAAPASFEEVRGKLPLAYLVARKKQATAAYLQRAFTRYRVTLGGERVATLAPTARVPAEPEPVAD